MALKEGLFYFLTKVAICVLLRIGVNTSTCTQRAF